MGMDPWGAKIERLYLGVWAQPSRAKPSCEGCLGFVLFGEVVLQVAVPGLPVGAAWRVEQDQR